MFETELRVKPVKRYRVPRYPSHADPDPTLHPQPVPYPASRKFLASVAMGLAASSGCDQPAATGGAAGAAPSNPFTVAVSGLPHRTSPYGTGVPNYLDAELARRVIERTFQQAGYRLARQQTYDRDGVAMVIDGYDARKKVGYVFGNYRNLDDDAVIRWWAARAAAAGLDAEIDALERTLQYEPEAKELAEIKQARQLDPQGREAAFRAILAKRSRALISMGEIQQLEDRGPRDKEFIAVISQFDPRFISEHWYTADKDETAAINAIPDPAKREAASRAMQEKLARVAIERLEKSVREYIAWARSPGGE
jgi:hypothetical protein